MPNYVLTDMGLMGNTPGGWELMRPSYDGSQDRKDLLCQIAKRMKKKKPKKQKPRRRASR